MLCLSCNTPTSNYFTFHRFPHAVFSSYFCFSHVPCLLIAFIYSFTIPTFPFLFLLSPSSYIYFPSPIFSSLSYLSFPLAMFPLHLLCFCNLYLAPLPSYFSVFFLSSMFSFLLSLCLLPVHCSYFTFPYLCPCSFTFLLLYYLSPSIFPSLIIFLSYLLRSSPYFYLLYTAHYPFH